VGSASVGEVTCRHRASVLAVLLLPLLVLVDRPAGAASYVDTAVAQLRSDPVYVDPTAELASQVDANAVRAKIRSSSSPVVVAVLPAAAAQEVGGIDQLPARIGSQLGGSVTVAVVAGTLFRAASSALASGVASRTATEVFNRSESKGVTAVLTDFVGAV
jgi:hypothetical protein